MDLPHSLFPGFFQGRHRQAVLPVALQDALIIGRGRHSGGPVPLRHDVGHDRELLPLGVPHRHRLFDVEVGIALVAIQGPLTVRGELPQQTVDGGALLGADGGNSAAPEQ